MKYFLWIVIVVSSAFVVFGAARLIMGANVATQVAPTSQAESPDYIVPIPHHEGHPYGDCFKGPDNIAYTTQADCTRIGGDRWQKQEMNIGQ
jgi:hypothetical protein